MGYTSYLAIQKSDLVVKKSNLEKLVKNTENLSHPFWKMDNFELDELPKGRVEITGVETDWCRCYDMERFFKRLSKIVIKGEMTCELTGEEQGDVTGYQIKKNEVLAWGYRQVATKKRKLK